MKKLKQIIYASIKRIYKSCKKAYRTYKRKYIIKRVEEVQNILQLETAKKEKIIG